MGLLSVLNRNDSAEDSLSLDGDAVERTAMSEYHPNRKSPGLQLSSDEDLASPQIAALHGSKSAKSFTAGAANRRFLNMDESASQNSTDGVTTPRPGNVPHTSINDFHQRVELYRSSISAVFRAVCTASDCHVIIKAYDKAKMKPKNVTRMEREIALMREFGKTEGMVELYSVFEDEGHTYLVMEHCKGGDLFKLLMLKGGTLNESWACVQILAPLLRVLSILHARSVIHRDIKPENIFLTAGRTFKLGDLGLAIVGTDELPFTRSGTLDYMAPEVLANKTTDLTEGPLVTSADLKCRGIRPYDNKVDIWAAGILAYELVTGRPPFEVKDETATMIMFSNNIAIPPGTSPAWAAFVRAALVKKPSLRPTAEQMLNHPWIIGHLQAAIAKPPCVERLDRTQLGAMSGPLPAATVERAIAQVRADSAGLHRSASERPAPTQTAPPSWPSAARPGMEEGAPLPLSPLRGPAALGKPARQPSKAASFFASYGKKGGAHAGKARSSEVASDAHSSADAGHCLKEEVSSSGEARASAKGSANLLQAALHKTRGPAAAMLGTEESGSSFSALLRSAVPISLEGGTVDSADLGDQEATTPRSGGLRTRMRNYFNRQKGAPGTLPGT